MTEASTETVDFGAHEAFGAHVFRVQIPDNRTEEVLIVEDYGLKGGTGGVPYEECRVRLRRAAWSAIHDAARRDFNDRLKAAKVSTGRWKPGKTLVDRLLGKELCVLAWAAEHAKPDEYPVICSKWAALRPEERWWLFSVTAAEAGMAEDAERGWRRALHLALSDGERVTTERRVRRRPTEEKMPGLFDGKQP